MLFGLVQRRFNFDVAFASECGLVRKENQDHLVVDRDALVFCVADGMGGGEAGGQASDIVCRSVESSLRSDAGFADRVRIVDDAIRRADGEIRSIAEAAGYRQMGSTAAVLVSDGRRIAAVGNVGDSRVYRMRAGKLRQITRDHTIAAELRSRRASADGKQVSDLWGLAFSHVLTRAVGVGQERIKVDWRKIDIAGGDVLVVCSDGVHGAVSHDELSNAVSLGGTAKDILDRMFSIVLASGARDNYTAIVVKIGGGA